MEVNESPTNMMYKIDDRTGPWVEVRKWMDENVSVLLNAFVPHAVIFGYRNYMYIT